MKTIAVEFNADMRLVESDGVLYVCVNDLANALSFTRQVLLDKGVNTESPVSSTLQEVCDVIRSIRPKTTN